MTEIFGPGWGNYAIRGIVEAQVPDSVPLVPQTPGWWLLLAALLAWLLRVLWRRRQRYLANRYRREAAAALAAIEARVAAGEREALRELAPLLRATAIAAGERRDLASLQGAHWTTALQELAPELAPPPVDALERLAYAPLDRLADIDTRSLFDGLDRWIAEHEGAHA